MIHDYTLVEVAHSFLRERISKRLPAPTSVRIDPEKGQINCYYRRIRNYDTLTHARARLDFREKDVHLELLDSGYTPVRALRVGEFYFFTLLALPCSPTHSQSQKGLKESDLFGMVW